ncbi:MAG: hypothetical protein ACI8PZ_004185 [Myxococcota bacterium]
MLPCWYYTTGSAPSVSTRRLRWAPGAGRWRVREAKAWLQHLSVDDDGRVCIGFEQPSRSNSSVYLLDTLR